MIPEADIVVNAVAAKILTDIAPNLPAGYGQGSSGTLAMTLLLAAQDYDKAADTRVWENARMRELLARRGTVPESDMSDGPTVKISALNAVNHRLKAQLIALHEAVEADESAEARALEKDILMFLKESADRRRLYLPQS